MNEQILVILLGISKLIFWIFHLVLE